MGVVGFPFPSMKFPKFSVHFLKDSFFSRNKKKLIRANLFIRVSFKEKKNDRTVYAWEIAPSRMKLFVSLFLKIS